MSSDLIRCNKIWGLGPVRQIPQTFKAFFCLGVFGFFSVMRSWSIYTFSRDKHPMAGIVWQTAWRKTWLMTSKQHFSITVTISHDMSWLMLSVVCVTSEIWVPDMIPVVLWLFYKWDNSGIVRTGHLCWSQFIGFDHQGRLTHNRPWQHHLVYLLVTELQGRAFIYPTNQIASLVMMHGFSKLINTGYSGNDKKKKPTSASFHDHHN